MKTIDIVGQNYFGSYQKTRTACRAIIIVDDMVLLSFEKNNDLYMLPGGGIEENETDQECVKREVEEETGYIIDTNQCILEIDEYYEDVKYITKYFFGTIKGKEMMKLTPVEARDGMEPRWMKLDEAIHIFSEHETYRNNAEMKRGLYLREYTALKHFTL